MADTVSDSLNWLQATSFYLNRHRDELHERGQTLTFIDQLLRDTSLKTAADIRTCMVDRDVWRIIVAR